MQSLNNVKYLVTERLLPQAAPDDLISHVDPYTLDFWWLTQPEGIERALYLYQAGAVQALLHAEGTVFAGCYTNIGSQEEVATDVRRFRSVLQSF